MHKRVWAGLVASWLFLVWAGVGTVVMAVPVTVTWPAADGSRTQLRCPDLRAAQLRVRQLNAEKRITGPVEVVLHNGVHAIAKPLRFTPEDSGSATAPITYRAETPGGATVSGGMRIRGWEPAGNGVWQASIPEVREGTLYFRQLFVDGRRAVRARSPNHGFFHTAGLLKRPEHSQRQAHGFYVAGNDLTADMLASPDAMIVAYQSWLSRQYRVKEYRAATKAVVTEPQMDIMRSRSRYLLENAPMCLDAPGEWYLDRRTGIVRYMPLPGEDMHKAQVIVPVTPALLQFRGVPEKGEYVEYVRFEGLRFEYADWTPQGRSISGGQARCPTGVEDPDVILESGAISAIGLRHAAFERCEVTHVGAHAITLLGGCADNAIRTCHLHDLGGGGVYLYWAVPQPDGKRPSWRPRGEFDHIVRNVIDNCFIHDMTHVFNGSVGILTGPCAAYNRITHNEVSYGDYTGISVGWGWSARKTYGYYQDGNVVEYNHVHHVMNYLLDDGGGIYLLGWQEGARVCYNWIHDVQHDPLGHGAKGIYPDQGTSGVLFEGNMVHDVVQGFGGNGGHECVVRNNIFAFCRKSGVIGGSKWWHEQVKNNPNPIVFENNIAYQDNGCAMIMRTGYEVEAQVSRNNVYRVRPERTDAGLFSGAERTFVSFAEWQAAGHDVGSVMADPLFMDVGKRDLRLRLESPALKMGFKQTDITKVGLYGPPDWTTLPSKVTHAPIAPLPGPGGFVWDYEDELAGTPPVHSGQLAPGPPELQHAIRVTDADAVSGKHCLELVEGKNSERGFFPFLHYPIGIATGTVRASCRVKMPSATPSAFYFSFRDYNNTGSQYFQTGPYISVDSDGVLSATEDADVAVPLPRDVWVMVEITYAVGDGTPKTFDLSVTAPEQQPRTFRAVPYKDAGFALVSDLYIVSTGPDGGRFLIDDVSVAVVNAHSQEATR